MNTKLKLLFVSLMICFSGKGFAQEEKVTDYFNEMKNHDLSVVITAKLLTDDGGETTFERKPIIGFLGDNYQRLHVHFISVIKNPNSPYEYLAYGKTKAGNNICAFQGVIKIVEAKLYVKDEERDEFPEYKQGYTVCEVLLFEDGKENSTGFFKGKLKSWFSIDSKGFFDYDALMAGADIFYNNQFAGSWTSYKTNSSKKCHWGDEQVHEDGDFGGGIGEFQINPKYLNNGWSNYNAAYHYSAGGESQKKALEKEREKWWNNDK